MAAVGGVDELGRKPDAVPDLAHAALDQCVDAEAGGDLAGVEVLALEREAEVRAATRSPGTRASALESSSVIPSLKYSFSRSGVRLTKGRTAIAGVEPVRHRPGAVGSGAARPARATAGSGSVPSSVRSDVSYACANLSAPARSPAAAIASMQPTAIRALSGSARASCSHHSAARRHVATSGRRFRQRLQRPPVTLGEPRPLSLDPMLELGRAGQEKPVQKRPPVHADRAHEVARLECRGELHQIHRHQLRIERELGRAQEQALDAEITAQAVEQLGQAVECVLGGAVRPEIGDELVATESPAARRAEQRQQRKAFRCEAAPGGDRFPLSTDRPPSVNSRIPPPSEPGMTPM